MNSRVQFSMRFSETSVIERTRKRARTCTCAHARAHNSFPSARAYRFRETPLLHYESAGFISFR